MAGTRSATIRSKNGRLLTAKSGVASRLSACAPDALAASIAGTTSSALCNAEYRRFDTAPARGILQHVQVLLRRNRGIGEHRQPAQAGHRFDQNVLPLAVEFGRNKLIPVVLPPGRASESTSPARTISSVMATSGMVGVSCCIERCIVVRAADDGIRRGLDQSLGRFGKLVVATLKPFGST